MIAIIFIVILMLIYVLSVCYLLKNNRLRESTFFVASVIPLGIAIMLFTSAHAWSDGTVHFWTVYHLSNQVLGASGEDEWKARYEDIELFERMKDESGIAVTDELFEDFHFLSEDNHIEYMPVRPFHMAYYSIISYLPETIGLTFARALNLSGALSFLLARIFIFMVYVLFTYRAIVRAPVGKSVFMVLSLMPFTLLIASSFSYDAIVYIAALNFISCIFSLRYDYSRFVLIEAFIFVFILGAIKGGGYLLLLPLSFIILCVDRDIISKRNKIFIIIGLIFTGLISAFIFDIVVPAGMELFQFSKDSDGRYLANFVWQHPIKYIWIVIKTYIENIINTILVFGGTKTGYLNIILMLLGPIYACTTEPEFKLSKPDKIISAVVVALVFIFTPMMLLGYSESGGYTVSGLRARYYLPIMPILLILIGNSKSIRNCISKLSSETVNALDIKRVCYLVIMIVNIVGVVRIAF